jgi:phosphoserine phosphatase
MAVDFAIFDLDGTLLRGPTVCEVLAGPLGRTDEMRAIEMITDRAEMEAARHTMADWYNRVERDVLVGYLDGAELAPGAMEGCQRLRAGGVRIAIASITWDVAVAHFATLFGAQAWIGTIHRDDGTIRHCWAETKAEWICGLGDPARMAAVGDTRRDVPMLQIVGLPIFVGETLPEGAPAETRHMPAADIREVADVILGFRDRGR